MTNVNIIKKNEIGKELWDQITDDVYVTSYQEHRKQSNFYTRWVFEVSEEYFPNHPELWGFWESDTFIHDTEYGGDFEYIDTLYRVTEEVKIVETREWMRVK